MFGSMQDGRFFRTHHTSCDMHIKIAHDAKIPSSDSTSLRNHMQRNGLKVIDALSGACGGDRTLCTDMGIGVPPPAQTMSRAFSNHPPLQD
jgi:hypothetical protein